MRPPISSCSSRFRQGRVQDLKLELHRRFTTQWTRTAGHRIGARNAKNCVSSVLQQTLPIVKAASDQTVGRSSTPPALAFSDCSNHHEGGPNGELSISISFPHLSLLLSSVFPEFQPKIFVACSLVVSRFDFPKVFLFLEHVCMVVWISSWFWFWILVH